MALLSREPLQSVCCGATSVIRGSTDSLRSDVIHDGLDVHLTTVDLPTVDAPQFDGAPNRMGFEAKPVAPNFEPDVLVAVSPFAEVAIWGG